MSGEKTEQPTAKKLRDARKKGQVAKSKEIASTATILACFGLIWMAGDKGMKVIGDAMMLPEQLMTEPFEEALAQMLSVSFMAVVWITAPVLAVVVAAAVIGNMAQVGVLFSLDGLKPEFKKINPVEGAKKIFSKDNLFEAIKSVLKILILGLIMWFVIGDTLEPMLLIPLLGPGTLMPVFGGILRQIVLFTAAAFAIASVADYLFQKHQHIEKLKMSKDEVKREHKDSEGDPLIKGKRRQMHREMSQNNMLNQVRKATVVITNPTHRAVAVFYDKDSGGLPVVVGKGADHLAKRIIAVAEEEGIPIMQNIPLARALYDDAEVDRFIPAEFIKPVAEVLRWVRSLETKGKED